MIYLSVSEGCTGLKVGRGQDGKGLYEGGGGVCYPVTPPPTPSHLDPQTFHLTYILYHHPQLSEHLYT